jgi:signal transduction histidine kinase/CheY-like chemotaxis protein
MLGYLLVLIYNYLLVLPKKRVIPLECIRTQKLSKKMVREKDFYLESIGYFMVSVNLFTLIFRVFIHSKNMRYYVFSEAYLFSIFIWVLVLKRSVIWMVLMVLTVLILNVINISIHGSKGSINSIVSSINWCIVSCAIMMFNQYEKVENYESKTLLKEKKKTLRKILRLFPQGIILYNQKEGFFYKNNFWLNMVDGFQKLNKKFWQLKRKRSDNSLEEFAENEPEIECWEEDRDTHHILGSLYGRDNKEWSLKDQILKIFKYYSQNKLELSKIDKHGVDEFIFKENCEHNEYILKDEKGNVIGDLWAKIAAFNFSEEGKWLMVVLHDISERTRLRESKISERLKTIMLWSISHELRSPVNQINGVLTLLMPTLVSNRQKELLKIANSSTELLKLKVNDMLDFYEIETHKFKPEKRFFDPKSLFIYIKKVFMPVIDKKCLKLYFLIHEDIPDKVYQDPERIQQVLANFVSNSIKYTKKGIICISADWISSRGSNTSGKIKFSVSDTGIGIAKKKRENLFNFLDPRKFQDTFEEEENQQAITTKLAGTGLGIAHRIVAELGSLIEFTSTEGWGSLFWFTIDVSISNEMMSVKHLPAVCEVIEHNNVDSNSYDGVSDMNRTLKAKAESRSPSATLPRNQRFDIFDMNKLTEWPNLNNGKLLSNEGSKSFNYGRGWNRKRMLSDSLHDEDKNSSFSPKSIEKGLNMAESFIFKENFTKSLSIRGLRKLDSNIEKREIPTEDPLPIHEFPIFVENAGDFSHKISLRPKHHTASEKMPSMECKESASDMLLLTPKIDVKKPQSSYFEWNEEIKGVSSSQLSQASCRTSSKNQEISNSQSSVFTFAQKKSRFANKRPPSDTLVSLSNETLYGNCTQDEIHPKFKKKCCCPSILIVDDQYINRFIIKEFWDKFEIKYSEASDGQEAVNVVLYESGKSWCRGFELILMDLNMPVLGGIEASEIIMKQKKECVNPNLKIVAVTAFPSKTEKLKCEQVGISKFIVKPFTIDDFIELIKN